MREEKVEQLHDFIKSHKNICFLKAPPGSGKTFLAAFSILPWKSQITPFFPNIQYRRNIRVRLQWIQYNMFLRRNQILFGRYSLPWETKGAFFHFRWNTSSFQQKNIWEILEYYKNLFWTKTKHPFFILRRLSTRCRYKRGFSIDSYR